MNTEQAIEYTIKALESKESGMPDFMAPYKIQLIQALKDKKFLNEKYRKSMALALFSYSMHLGPDTFVATGDAVVELGVEVEFMEYTNHFKKVTFTERIMEVLYGK